MRHFTRSGCWLSSWQDASFTEARWMCIVTTRWQFTRDDMNLLNNTKHTYQKLSAFICQGPDWSDHRCARSRSEMPRFGFEMLFLLTSLLQSAHRRDVFLQPSIKRCSLDCSRWRFLFTVTISAQANKEIFFFLFFNVEKGSWHLLFIRGN